MLFPPSCGRYFGACKLGLWVSNAKDFRTTIAMQGPWSPRCSGRTRLLFGSAYCLEHTIPTEAKVFAPLIHLLGLSFIGAVYHRCCRCSKYFSVHGQPCHNVTSSSPCQYMVSFGLSIAFLSDCGFMLMMAHFLSILFVPSASLACKYLHVGYIFVPGFLDPLLVLEISPT